MNNPKSVQPIPNGPWWIDVGEWSYPTKKNHYFNYVMYHKCTAQLKMPSRQLKEEDMEFTHCHLCGKKVPEGLRMIALLEKL